MQKRFEGLVNFGLVIFNDVLIPRRMRVTISDLAAGPGRQKPSVVIVFEVLQSRIKCISLEVHSLADNTSISSGLLSALNIENLGEEAIASLALQQKEGTNGELEVAQPVRGRRAARKLSDERHEPSKEELMHIGLHYSNPNNAKSPTQAVVKMMGYGSRDTAIRRIAKARAKGWVLPLGSSKEEVALHYEVILNELKKAANGK